MPGSDDFDREYVNGVHSRHHFARAGRHRLRPVWLVYGGGMAGVSSSDCDPIVECTSLGSSSHSI